MIDVELKNGKKMSTPGRFIILVLGIVIAAAAFMAPRRDEWLAMMSDDKKHSQIIALLEPKLEHNPNDIAVLATLGRSYAEIGNTTRAIELFQRYISLRQDDGDAYGYLADLYGATGERAKRITMLSQSVDLAPKLSRVAELAGAYHEDGRLGEELALLSRFEAEVTVQNGLLLRLAQLRADNSEPDSAIRLLMRPEVLSPPTRQKRNEEERLYLASMLVKVGRSSEAVQLGKQWIAEWHEAWLDNRLLDLVVPLAPVADSAQLAEASVVLHPDVRFFLVRSLAQRGASQVARRLLETWITANPSASSDEIAGFLSACREQNQPDIVWKGFEDLLRVPASTDLIARYSEAIAAEFGIGALAPFWGELPQAVLEHNPLLAARLAFHEGQPAMAKLLLRKADPEKLEATDQRLWIDLLTAVASPAEVFDVLRDLRQAGRLPSSFMTRYARLAGGLGEENEYQAALAGLRRTVD